MYLGYFGLERDPFTISPDPAFLYPSPQHRQALAHLKYGLDREGGFVLLTGEVGTGKTTLTRLLLEQLPGNVRVAYILNARLNALDLLRSICHELELPQTADASVKALTDTLNRDLLATHAAGKKTLLIIEEAQNLDPDVLETLRLLTNLETNTTKLLHILLVGQPELLDLLARTELRQLNQRVVSRFHLDPLSLSETGHYLAHRLRRAGCNRALFDADTVRALYTRAAGIPRMLNLLAERTLLGTYASNAPRPTPKIARTAAREVLGTPPPRRPAPSSKAAEQTTPPDSPHRGPHRGPYPDLANTSKPPPPANRRPTLWLTGLLCTALLGSGTYAALNWPPNWRPPLITALAPSPPPPGSPSPPSTDSPLQPTQSPASSTAPQTPTDPNTTPTPPPPTPIIDPNSPGSNTQPPTQTRNPDSQTTPATGPQTPPPSPTAPTSAPPADPHTPPKSSPPATPTENPDPTRSPSPTAFDTLLAIWKIIAPTPAANRAELCRTAAAHGLRCEQDSTLKIKDLTQINRPGLVTLAESAERTTLYLLHQITADHLHLRNSTATPQIPTSDFAARWDGNFTYLWKPPPGYRGLLPPAARNPALVAWTQTQLQRFDANYEPVISGGLYTAPIVRAVQRFQTAHGLRPDGVLGPRTLMRLLEQTQPLPSLAPIAEQR